MWCAMCSDTPITQLVPDVWPGVWKSSLHWCFKCLVHPQLHFMYLLSAVIESSCLHSMSCYHLPATHHESWAGNNFPIPLKKKKKGILRLFCRKGKNKANQQPNNNKKLIFTSLWESLQMRRFGFRTVRWISSLKIYLF